MKYEFHLSHLSHFSHDYVHVTYTDLPVGKETFSGSIRVDLHGVDPTKIELNVQYYWGYGVNLNNEIKSAMQADREFIPALLRAKQTEIEKELASAQRKVEKLLEVRNRIRKFTAE